MIEIKIIDSAHQADINIPNQPFPIFGRMVPSYVDKSWSYTVERFEQETEMCFPDECYDYDEMSNNTVFIGAYDNDVCVGLAIIQDGFFKYMYLYDLKVDSNYRHMGIAKQLIDKAKETAISKGCKGIYTIGQDNNLAACRFYIKSGFRIGGLDTEVYKGTVQEGKADIIFYLDC